MNTRIYAHPCDIRYILKFIKKNWPGQKKSDPCAIRKKKNCPCLVMKTCQFWKSAEPTFINMCIYAHPYDLRYILKFKKKFDLVKKQWPLSHRCQFERKKNLTLDHMGRGKFEPPFPPMYLEFLKITYISWNYMWYYNLKNFVSKI